MSIDRIVLAVAGTMVLLSLLLAHFVSPYWYWFTAFVGANFLQSGITNWCLMETIMRKIGARAS